MTTRLKQKEEMILTILERLAEENAKGMPIVVEGKKDLETLRALSVNGRIVLAKSGRKSMLDVVFEIQKMSAMEVILLLDFDRRGKELTKHLKRHLEQMRITPITAYWSELFAIVRRDLKDIEGLAAYMETLKSKIGNS